MARPSTSPGGEDKVKSREQAVAIGFPKEKKGNSRRRIRGRWGEPNLSPGAPSRRHHCNPAEAHRRRSRSEGGLRCPPLTLCLHKKSSAEPRLFLCSVSDGGHHGTGKPFQADPWSSKTMY